MIYKDPYENSNSVSKSDLPVQGACVCLQFGFPAKCSYSCSSKNSSEGQYESHFISVSNSTFISASRHSLCALYAAKLHACNIDSFMNSVALLTLSVDR